MRFIEKFLDFFIPNYKVKFTLYKENGQYIQVEDKGYFITESSLIRKLEEIGNHVKSSS